MIRLIIYCLAILLSTSAYSQNWQRRGPVVGISFYDLDITSDSTCWAVSFTPPRVYKSNNYGINWTLNSSITTSIILKTITFNNNNIGFIGGVKPFGNLGVGSIYYTLNKGQSWTQSNINLNVSSIEEIEFVDSLNGYAVGYDGFMIVTTDGGRNWSSYSSPTLNHIKNEHVFGINHMLIASDKLYLRRPFNTWFAVHQDECHDIDFINDTIGFAITDSLVIKTIDQGLTWTTISTHQLSSNAISTINALSENEIYIGGMNNEVYRTIDGGVNWTLDYPTSNNLLITSLIQFKNDIWLTGTSGQIRKRVSTLVSIPELESKKEKHLLYPNPFKTSVKSDFLIEEIEIYSLSGDLIFSENIIYKNEINLSRLNNGIYFAVLTIDGKKNSQKIIKID